LAPPLDWGARGALGPLRPPEPPATGLVSPRPGEPPPPAPARSPG